MAFMRFCLSCRQFSDRGAYAFLPCGSIVLFLEETHLLLLTREQLFLERRPLRRKLREFLIEREDLGLAAVLAGTQPVLFIMDVRFFGSKGEEAFFAGVLFLVKSGDLFTEQLNLEFFCLV